MATINAQIVRLISTHVAQVNIMMIMIQLCSLVTPNASTNNQIKKNTKTTSKPKRQQVPLMER
tara:strand:+ start:117 stop:305 length:189 start_codon:yes stop_codon:yes gene_type:complete